MLVKGATDQYYGPLCGVHRRALDSPHKGSVIRKAFTTWCDVINSYRSTRSISLQQPLPEKAEEAWFRPWHVERSCHVTSAASASGLASHTDAGLHCYWNITQHCPVMTWSTFNNIVPLDVGWVGEAQFYYKKVNHLQSTYNRHPV